MAGLLEALFGDDTATVDQLQPHTGNDRDKAEQAYTAAAGTILQGLEQKTQTKEGAQSIWDMLRKHVDAGNISSEAPSPQPSGMQVRDLDPKVANDIMKSIFGKDAPDVQGGFAKVITLDPETSKKVFEKVLPSVLGSVFGAAEAHPDESPQALPKVLSDARQQIEQRQPNASNIFSAILDRDHDGDVDLDDLVGLLRSKPR